jgi:hypothetical protein
MDFSRCASSALLPRSLEIAPAAIVGGVDVNAHWAEEHSRQRIAEMLQEASGGHLVKAARMELASRDHIGDGRLGVQPASGTLNRPRIVAVLRATMAKARHGVSSLRGHTTT